MLVSQWACLGFARPQPWGSRRAWLRLAFTSAADSHLGLHACPAGALTKPPPPTEKDVCSGEKAAVPDLTAHTGFCRLSQYAANSPFVSMVQMDTLPSSAGKLLSRTVGLTVQTHQACVLLFCPHLVPMCLTILSRAPATVPGPSGNASVS